MSQPSHIRVAIFLGAGASGFANFPTVDSFFEHAWPRREGVLDELCSQLARRISILEGNNDHRNWPSFDAEKLFAWLEILEKAHKIQTIDGRAHSVVVLNSRGTKMPADELMSKLKREIVRVYGTPVQQCTLETAPHSSLFRLLDTLMPETEVLDVFTTNYDRLLEELFRYWDSGTVNPMSRQPRLCTGFSSGQSREWQPKLFGDQPNSGTRLIRLAKLHGSTTWKKNPDGSIVDAHPFAQPTDYNILLYFGYKSIPEEEPFLSLHNLLKLTLFQCHYLIAIGFRFADPYIYELFDLALRANSNLQVIYCLSRVPDSGSPLSTMKEQFPGRVRQLVNPKGDPIPFGHPDFQESLRALLTGTNS